MKRSQRSTEPKAVPSLVWHLASNRRRQLTAAILAIAALVLLVGHRYGDTPPPKQPGELKIKSTVAEIMRPQESRGWCLVVTMGGRYAAYVTSKTPGNFCKTLKVGDSIEATGTGIIGGGTRMPIMEVDKMTKVPASP